MRGILGNPMIRGKSDVIEPARFTADLTAAVSGVAVSPIDSASDNDQLTFAAFDGESFAGFVCANDLNLKTKTAGLIEVGRRIPVKITTGKTFAKSKGVFLDANGTLVPEGDAAAIYQLNGKIRDAAYTGLTSDNKEVACVTIDLYGGGAAFSAA